MADYDNTNSGALFKNDKGDNEKRPDYKGSVDVEGKVYNVSSWLQTAKSGQKFLSLKLEIKVPKDTLPPMTKPVDADDLPF